MGVQAGGKKLIVAIILTELVLLVLNALRFNRSESYFFGQDGDYGKAFFLVKEWSIRIC